MASVTLMEESAAAVVVADEVELVTCHCCGLEECTPGYIAREREKHQGRWICGLCATAIEDDKMKLRKEITADEAIKRHVKVVENFRSLSHRSVDSEPPTAAEKEETADLLISKVMQLMRRTLDSPRRMGSGSGGGGAFDRRLLRSKSCFSTIGEKGRLS